MFNSRVVVLLCDIPFTIKCFECVTTEHFVRVLLKGPIACVLLCVQFLFLLCLDMVISLSIQYNGGFPPHTLSC